MTDVGFRQADGQERAAVNVSRLIDADHLTPLQIFVILVCTLVATLDGYDLQVIGLAAPYIAAELHVKRSELGVVFSAAILGMIIGGFALGRLGDRIGRKSILAGATACFAIFTLLTPFATSTNELVFARFLTGIGLGGAAPNFVALISEYAPEKKRSRAISLAWTGTPVGGVIGGALSSHLIPTLGWKALFYIGGAVPLLLVLVLLVALPESLSILMRKPDGNRRIQTIARRLRVKSDLIENCRYVSSDNQIATTSFRFFFSGGRTVETLLTWGAFFCVFSIAVSLTAWAPTLLSARGSSAGDIGSLLAAFSIGSAIGTFFIGALIDRFGRSVVLIGALLAGAMSVVGFGYATSFAQMIVTVFLCGLLLASAIAGLIVFAAALYPPVLRATGVGLALALGRAGSFVGPLVGAWMVSERWASEQIFASLAIPALVSTLLVLLLKLRRKTDSKSFEATINAH